MQLGLELGICGKVVEDVDEDRVGGVGASDLYESGEIYVRKSEVGGSEGGAAARGMCVGRKRTYLHRHCIVDEGVTVDRPSRGRVFAANDITHNVRRLWLILCGQKFC